jgi:hypothetical protein
MVDDNSIKNKKTGAVAKLITFEELSGKKTGALSTRFFEQR